MEQIVHNRSTRSAFRRLGWALTVLAAVSLLISLFSAALYAADEILASSGKDRLLPLLEQLPLASWLLFRLPLYAIGFSAAAVILKKLPADPVQKHLLSGKQLIGYLLVAMAVQIPINLLISLFTDFLYRDLAQPIQAHAPSFSLGMMLDMVLLAPIAEEFLFRKLLLDRFRRYGEGLAILLSAVTFGLMHMNLQQAVTATVFGVLLAYVYLRSGSLWSCVFLHSLSNFLAHGMMSLLFSRLSPKSWMLLQSYSEDLFTPDVVADILPLLAYTLFIHCMVPVGWFILLRNRKKLALQPSADPLPPRQAVSAVFGSVGISLYLAVSLLVIISGISAPLLFSLAITGKIG